MTKKLTVKIAFFLGAVLLTTLLFTPDKVSALHNGQSGVVSTCSTPGTQCNVIGVLYLPVGGTGEWGMNTCTGFTMTCTGAAPCTFSTEAPNNSIVNTRTYFTAPPWPLPYYPYAPASGLGVYLTKFQGGVNNALCYRPFFVFPNLSASITCPGSAVPAGQPTDFTTTVSSDAPGAGNTMTGFKGSWETDGEGKLAPNPGPDYPDNWTWTRTAPATPGTYTATVFANACNPSVTGLNCSPQITEYDLYVSGNNTNNIATCSFTVSPPATPPVINSLNITQGPPGTSFSGTAGISGRQNAESGSNWFNSININVNASAGSGSIRDFRVDFAPGFSIAYSPTSGGNCSSGNYCVLDGSWQNIVGSRNVPSGCDPSSNCQIRVDGAGNGSDFASWHVYFYRSFGSKSMGTSATVTNTNGLSTSGTF